MTGPRTSVVIPTYRRADDLARCLHGLQQQVVAPHEVIIAVRDDDADTRAVLATFRDTPLNLITVDVGTCNASEARNLALQHVTGEIVALIDDDTVPRAGWLAHLTAHYAADPAIGGVGGPDWFHGEEVPLEERPPIVGQVQWWGRRVGNHHLGSATALDVEWLKGANMSFRLAALQGGLFGEGLRGDGAQFAEDVALSLRIRRSGSRLIYDPAVAVDHFPGPLMAGVDHRALVDDTSLGNAAHNETVAMLGYLPWHRRAVFLAWSVLIGTKLLPGVAAALFLALQRRPDMFRRWVVVLQGRIQGWRTWSRAAGRRRTAIARRELTRPARVCIVTHAVTRGDGQGRVNFELARYLVRRGHHVTLVASRVQRDLLHESGINWIRIPVPEQVPALVRWGLFAVVARLRLGSDSLRQFDIIHLNGAIAPLPAHINTSHFVHAGWQRAASHAPRHGRFGTLYQRLVTEIARRSERHAYRAAARVVAVSNIVRDSLASDVGVPPGRLAVIHTGVDSTEFTPRTVDETNDMRRELGIAPNQFLLLFVGDAKSARKNLDLPLRMLTRLDRDFHLAVVGGADGGPYAILARQLGVAARAHFLGARADVAACYRAADALICAAHYEPASLVLLEAMACGLPVISTADVGNAAFLLNGENGFLLQSSTDADAAVDIVKRLATDAALKRRVGERARETALLLSWERMGQAYESLYFGQRGAA